MPDWPEWSLRQFIRSQYQVRSRHAMEMHRCDARAWGYLADA
jgi:hypothetical protein